MPSGAPSFPLTPPAVLLNRPAVQSWLPAPGFIAGLGSLSMHCNPTDKKIGTTTTARSNPNAHLDCWKLAPGPFTLPSGLVSFTNQFGTGALKFTAAVSLCVPSYKSLTVANLPSPGNATPPGLDHLTCYSVTNPVGTPQFTLPSSATLTDQFFAHATTVGSPNLLCSPVSKIVTPPTGTATGDPQHYLVCFVIPASAAFSPRVVFGENQFGKGAVVVLATRELCVPSTQP
jgi:hypothetical protein